VSEWTARELLTQFQVWGRFYEANIAGESEHLRSHLELFPIEWEPHRAVGAPADLIVVMMNPGSSQPMPGRVNHGDFKPTRPDNTQYQILRLMLLAQTQGRSWRHARVINLSDLRTPKSAELFDKLNRYSCDDRHSIFSSSRVEELSLALGPIATPVLRAWGLSPILRIMANRALSILNPHPFLGLSIDSISYRHPLPQRIDLQRAWLKQVFAQLCEMDR
jgi:hypothetical protein